MSNVLSKERKSVSKFYQLSISHTSGAHFAIELLMTYFDLFFVDSICTRGKNKENTSHDSLVLCIPTGKKRPLDTGWN